MRCCYYFLEHKALDVTEWMANSKTDGTSTWANLFVDNLDFLVLAVDKKRQNNSFTILLIDGAASVVKQ